MAAASHQDGDLNFLSCPLKRTLLRPLPVECEDAPTDRSLSLA